MTAFSTKYYRSLHPLLHPPALEQPVDWADIFGRPAPLELEIGFGNGEYIHRTTLENCHRNYVGVEVDWASVKRALRRLASPPRDNARIMICKAEVALERLFPEKSLGVIRSLFPIPWPDEKHQKKRLFSRKFLDLAASRLADDGSFILVTDDEPLARWTLGQATESALNFQIEKRPAEIDTKYARKWLDGGQRHFYHLTGHKKFHPEPPEIPGDMQMQAYFRNHLDPDNFKPQGCTGEDIVVRFKEFVFDKKSEQGLLRALVVEGNLTQEFFIRIMRMEDRWKLSPAISGQIFPTLGVARALELATLNCNEPG